MKLAIITLLAISLFASKTNAWGHEGHIIVGTVAQGLIKPEVAARVKGLIQDPQYKGQLGPVAVWADEVKHNSKSPYGIWSEPLHFIDTTDNPSKTCHVDGKTDCPNGKCITSAIQNYTAQLDCKFDKHTRDIALRFITHFHGDLTQPLHVCGREKGGNGHRVTFNKKPKNLHGIWDEDLVLERLSNFSGINDYANHLVTQLKSGSFAQAAPGWASCSKPNPQDCTIEWAADTNKINCPTVWAYVESNPRADLSGQYYSNVEIIIDQQLAKGGLRLATVLNKLWGNGTKSC